MPSPVHAFFFARELPAALFANDDKLRRKAPAKKIPSLETSNGTLTE
jgi:hypothetical protein